MAEPGGVDPRVQATQKTIEVELLRQILAMLKSSPIQKPAGVCIEDLQNRGFSIGIPPR